MIRRILVLASVVALLGATVPAAGASPWETEEIFGQGPNGETVATNGAKINRGSKGVTAKVTMATPEPGSYNYPDTPTASGKPGKPEAFSLWVFIFFNPDACDGDCDAGDLAENSAVVAGAFNAGGHLVAGPNLTISGRVTEQNPTFGPANLAETIPEALAMGHEIADAEIHLAVAPHGALSPKLLPAQIKTPAGSPADWWLAIFE